ncbi:MAG: FkbM family methyltransferase [Candidatus Moranbacteria bacterium]|nr:FkbM family methyltransferase [Candidatus Moranbacteria bacterium]
MNIKNFIYRSKIISDKIDNLSNDVVKSNSTLTNISKSIEEDKKYKEILNNDLVNLSNNLHKIKNELSRVSLEKNINEFEKRCYSQDGEDVVLAAFYETKPDFRGFYVDIGAFHPFRFSNTQYFYEKGWRGINVDATPGSMNEFDEFRSGDVNVEIGVSTDGKDLTFYCFEEGALNSFDKKISEKRVKQGWKMIGEKKVKTMSVNSLLEKYLPKNQKIDFINIDIEGLELGVLKSLDWNKYKPDFLLIEELTLVDKDIVKFGDTDMYGFLNGLGYGIVARTKRTLIFKNARK